MSCDLGPGHCPSKCLFRCAEKRYEAHEQNQVSKHGGRHGQPLPVPTVTLFTPIAMTKRNAVMAASRHRQDDPIAVEALLANVPLAVAASGAVVAESNIFTTAAGQPFTSPIAVAAAGIAHAQDDSDCRNPDSCLDRLHCLAALRPIGARTRHGDP